MNFAVMAGLVIMVVSEAATLGSIEPFWSWNTPIAWTGFLLFADGVAFKVRGESWIRTYPREFAALALCSIPLWLVFEFYNRFIENWYYVGLPDNRALRLFGYAWSFATIWPAIFEGAELVAVRRDRRSTRPPTLPPSLTQHKATAPPLSRLWIASTIAGAAMLIWPLVWPSRYLAAPIWLGFVFLLDPINARLGGASIMAEAVAGTYTRLIDLLLSGILCGVLWEFWNYWSRAKWHYTVPIMEHVKIFEMPLPGYFGFPAFAVECFTMYVFVRVVCLRLTA